MTGKKILVFEDNPSIQTLLRLFLVKRGAEVRLENDGVDAVAAARAFSPSLIVMDMIMPGKDGLEACTDLRQAGITTPIVMLTSKNYADDMKRGLEAGANAYLLKPFSPSELEKTLQSLMTA